MSAAALERQIRPVYEAIDTGSNKSAIVTCNKLLKKHPKNTLIKALKALALVRTQKVEESLVLCDEVLAAKSTEDATLSAMMHVLRGLGRHADMITMFEDAFKQQPTNEELGAQTFFANVRTGHWKAAQQIATRMHKQFQEDRYLYWSVISAILQANDPSTPPTMRTVLYKLAHRLVTSSPTPSYITADRFHLHLTIVRQLGLFDEAHTLLESDIGKSICSTSLVCDEIRRDIWRLRGLWKEEGERAEWKIVENKDRNWLEFLSVLDATFSYDAASHDNVNEADSATLECSRHIERTRELFIRTAEGDGQKDRSGLLALLELEKRARARDVSTNPMDMVNLMQKYFQSVGDKACCFEDLKPYLALEGEDMSRWTTFLDSVTVSSATLAELRRSINVHKLRRHNLSESQLTIDSESARASSYLEEYLGGLKLGDGLPETELQPADDLAILTGQTFVSLWKLTGAEGPLYKAVAVLEFASTKSTHSFQIRLLLIRIYRLLGAPSLALEHYRQINVKQIQNDTLSHFILSRASTFSLSATGDLTYTSECLESSQIYMSNSQETSDFVVRAFTAEKYSQIPDFITFEDRLDNSLQRDSVKIEHVRMRVAHEQITSDLIDLELIELKFIFDRFHYDNRDFEILPNYQPRCQPSFNQQTLLFDSNPGMGWLWVFLKVYIRAFQQASDLDDTVEDKLLVGDRPKQSHDPESKLPLKERLAIRKQDELEELTPDEILFLNYADALATWLEPYHTHARPPPAVVLAEATKQTERKTGHALKSLETLPQNGSATNGRRKDEEPPTVKEPPEMLIKFFESMQARFEELVARKRSPSEILHVITLAQEALMLFVIETIRFKAASIVKIHKFGALVQIVKAVRAKAAAVLHDMSSRLAKMGEQEATAERRGLFIDICQNITSSEIDNEFILDIAKKVTDARRKVMEGVSKGASKICSTYA